MKYLEREEETQRTVAVLPYLSTNDLRRLRAWYADLIEDGGDCREELVALRGEIIHEEIKRRTDGGDDVPEVPPARTKRSAFGKVSQRREQWLVQRRRQAWESLVEVGSRSQIQGGSAGDGGV